MALHKAISSLSAAASSIKLELYSVVERCLSDQSSSTDAPLQEEDVNNLYSEILKDISDENPDLQCLLIKILQSLIQKKEQLLNVEQKQSAVQRIVTELLNPTQNEKVLLNAFQFLIQTLSYIKMDSLMLKAVLEKIEGIMLEISVSVAVYFSLCNCFQRIVKEYVSEVVNFMPIFIKMVFMPLIHPSTKVREVAGKTLDLCPTNLIFSQEDLSFLLKFVKETLPKDLVVLFKDKQELYVLKIWSNIVTILGKNLHSNLPAMTPFFQVIEKGFKSSTDTVCIAAFVAWKSLISNFALSADVLNDSKKLRFVLKPFKNISRLSENVLLNVCNTWWHLVWHLSHNLSMRFTEVCIPLLELTVGKSPIGLSEKPIPKGGLPSLIKRGCFILLLLLQPSADEANPITSPKKMPNMPYPSLQAPVDIKILVHHFKDIINAARVITETYGKKDEMKIHLDSLMKSILFIVSSIIEDESNKESIDAVITFLNFLNDIINEKICPPLLCLKSIESLSKISRRCLVSHIFNFGSRKSQDVLSSSLLKLLLNSYLFPSENPKRFYLTYNRLIQAGIHESLHPLPVTQRFLSIVKSVISTSNLDGESLLQMWSGIASPLVEVIEKTQDVNQGNKIEHDFSCMYEVLLCPVELIFPNYVQQFRAKPAFQLWSVLFKSFVRSASLVSTILPNETCEMFCSSLKNFIKTDTMKEPHFFESICFLLQVVVETVDFTSFGATSAEGILNSTLLVKQKKPLGNLTSLIDVFALLLKEFNSSYFESEHENTSFTPTAQRKVQVMKSAAPLDLLKTFFGNIKFGSVIPFVLEVLAEPLAAIISASGNKKTASNVSESKLTTLWNLVTSTIEQCYLGPYDNDFLLIMTPLLEASFTHPKRNFKERSRRFWFATFGPSSSPLIFPESLKIVLKRCKLPLLSDDIISPTDEFSATPTSQNSEDSVVHETVATEVQLKSVFAKPFAVKNDNKKENTPVTNKRSRLSAKMSIDDLPSEEFVKIDSPALPVVAKRKSIRKRKSFVPSLYNDLSQSQDTSNIESFSDSQEVNSVSSQEEPFPEGTVEKAADSAQNSENVVKNIEENASSEHHQSDISVIEPPAESAMEIDDDVHIVLSNHIIEDASLKASANVENTVKANLKTVPKSKTSLNKENELDSVICIGDSVCPKDSPMAENKKIKTCEKPFPSDDEVIEKFSVFAKSALKKTVNTRKRRSAKVNHTFDESDSKQRKEDSSLKLNHSCIETIEINDSDEIIPSSQSSTETENHLKLSFIESTSPDSSNVQKLLISQTPSLDKEQIKSSTDVKQAEHDVSTSRIVTAKSSPPNSQKDGLELEDFTQTSQKEDNVVSLEVDKFSDSFVLEHIATNILDKIETEVTVLSSLEKKPNCVSEPFNCKESKEDVLKEEVIQNKTFSELNVAASDEKDDSDIEIIEEKRSYRLKAVKKSEVNLSKKLPLAKKRRKSLTAIVKNVCKNDGSKLRRRISDIYERKVDSDSEKIDCDTSVINETPLLSDEVLDDSKAIGNKLQKEVQKEFDMESKINTTNAIKVIEDVCTKTRYFNEFASVTKSSICNLPELLKINAANEVTTSISKPTKYNLRTHKLPEMLEEKESNNSVSDLATHSPPKTAVETENACDHQICISSVTSCSENNSLEVKENELPSDNVMELDKSEKETVIGDILSNSPLRFIKIEAIKSLAELKKSLVAGTEPEVTSCDTFDEIKSTDERILSSNENEIYDQVLNTVNSLIDGVSTNACVSVTDENVNYESVKANQSDLHTETKALTACSLQPSQEKTVENFGDSCPVFSEAIEDEENILSEQISDIITRLDDNEGSDSQKVVSICNPCDKFAAEEIMEENNSENFDLVEINDMHSNNNDDVCSLSSTHESSCNENAQSVAFKTEPCSDSNPQENDVQLNKTDAEDNVFVEWKMVAHNTETNNISLNLPSEALNCNTKSFSQDIKSDVCIESTTREENEILILVDFIISSLEIKELCSGSTEENPSELSSGHHNQYLLQNKDSFSEDIQSKSSKEAQSALESEINRESIMDFDPVENENISVVDHSIEVHTSEKGSKKRKAKPPVRSPFNFRHRSKSDAVLNKPSKTIKSVTKETQFDILRKTSMSCSEIKKQMNDHMFSLKRLCTGSADEQLDGESVNIINESLDCEEVMIDYVQPTKMDVNYDELTNLHTRLNANTAPHTRRSQIFAASHMISNSVGKQIPKPIEENGMKQPTSSILKKENSISSRISSKNRVTFADPLVHEKIIEEGSEWNAIEISVVSDKPQSDNKRRKKSISGQKNKAVETKEIIVSAIESDDIPSSSEYQDSDTLTNYSDIPVSPSLINCEDSISCILEDLTSPTWIRGLESLLISKNIKTVGDVCRLNVHELKTLPFKSPKVLTLHKALLSHLDHTQQATLEKLNSIDDGCSRVKDNSSAPSEADEVLTDQAEKMEESSEDLQLQSSEKMIQEFLDQNKFNNLPNILLTRIIEKCANVLSQRL